MRRHLPELLSNVVLLFSTLNNVPAPFTYIMVPGFFHQDNLVFLKHSFEGSFGETFLGGGEMIVDIQFCFATCQVIIMKFLQCTAGISSSSLKDI